MVTDYGSLKQSWIRQGYNLSIVAKKGFDKKAKDGKFYTIIPPLDYKDFKDTLFSDPNVKASLKVAMDNFICSVKGILDTKEKDDSTSNLFFSPKDSIEKIKERWIKNHENLELLGCFMDIANLEAAIIECAPNHAPLLALYIVNLKNQRECPIKDCGHNRMCIIESRSYKTEKVLTWRNSKGVEKLSVLKLKECVKTHQPYLVGVDYNESTIFDYLFHLKHGECPLCNTTNENIHPSGDKYSFKCHQCGNEFEVYAGRRKYRGSNRYLTQTEKRLLLRYLIGCKILGLNPELLRKYEDMCEGSDNERINSFLREQIETKQGLFSYFHKELEDIRRGFTGSEIRKLFEEYECIKK